MEHHDILTHEYFQKNLWQTIWSCSKKYSWPACGPVSGKKLANYKKIGSAGKIASVCFQNCASTNEFVQKTFWSKNFNWVYHFNSIHWFVTTCFIRVVVSHVCVCDFERSCRFSIFKSIFFNCLTFLVNQKEKRFRLSIVRIVIPRAIRNKIAIQLLALALRPSEKVLFVWLELCKFFTATDKRLPLILFRKIFNLSVCEMLSIKLVKIEFVV